MRQLWAWACFIFRRRSRLEGLAMAFASALPPSVVYWAAVRLFANATTGEFGSLPPEEVTIFEALKHWRERRGGDRAWRK